MRWPIITGGVFAVAAVTAFAGWRSGYAEQLTDTSHGGITACEEALLSNLKAPSTYKRIAASFREESPLTMQQFREYTITGYCGPDGGWRPCGDLGKGIISYGAKQIALSKGIKGHPSPKQKIEMRHLYWEKIYAIYQQNAREHPPGIVELTYDAEDAYGTPLRSTLVCRFGIRSPDGYSPHDMYGDPNADQNDWLEE
jgi:hypothetical protein